MKKPSDDEVKNVYEGIFGLDDLYTSVVYGKDMIDKKHHGGEITWYIPKCVKSKIKDNEKYLIYYNFSTPADTSDTSKHYRVYYIENF